MDKIGILLSGKIDINSSAKEIDGQIRQLSEKISESITLKLKIDASQLEILTKEVEDKQKKLRTKTVMKDSIFINEKVEQQAFNEISSRIRELRRNVDELAKVDINTNKKGQMTSATLTYYNKALGQTVTETMGWSEAQKKVNGELTKVKTFETQGFKYSDNISKATQETKKFTQSLKDLNMYKQKMIGGDGFSGELDIFASKQKGRYNPLTLDDLRKNIDALNINTPDLDNKIKQLNIQFSSLKQNASQSASVLTNAIENAGKFLRFYLVGGMLVGFVGSLRSMVTTIKDIDTAMVEIKKVIGDINNQELEHMKRQASEIGKEFGKTTAEVLKATSMWAKAGFGQLSQELAKITMLASNVGDVSVESAQEFLLAANAGFQRDATTSIELIDKMNHVSNMNATSIEKLGDSFKVASSTAHQAGLSIDQFIALMGTSTSVTQRSGAEIGRAWRTILMNIQGVVDAEAETTEESISKAEKALNDIGIAVRKTSGEFRPVFDVISELASKFHILSDVQKSFISETLANKRQADILKGTLQNFSTVYKQLGESIDSAGSAMRENEVYMESIEAKSKQFRATWEQMAQSLINSDFIKSIVDTGTGLIGVLDNLINQFGGWNIAVIAANLMAIKFAKSLIAINVNLATKGILTWGNSLKALFPTLAGLTGLITGVNTKLTTMNLLAGGIPILIGVASFALLSYGNKQRELAKQLEEVKSSQEGFNNTLNDFNKTLDVTKVNALSQALENLKQATDYEKNIKDIEKLKKELDALYNRGFEDGDRYVENTKNKIADNMKKLQPVIEAQEKYNEAKELSNSLDYQAVENSLRHQAVKVKEIGYNLELVESYKKVYDKLTQGIELTKEESDLNDKLLKDYPQFSRLLNEKTKAVGVNYDALHENLTIQQSLAIVEWETMKTSKIADAERTKTKLVETEKRILAIEAEIKALDTLEEKMLEHAKRTGDLPSGAMYASTVSVNRKKQLAEELNQSKQTLNTLKLTSQAYDNIFNLSMEDLLSGGSQQGFFSNSSSSDKAKSQLDKIFSSLPAHKEQIKDTISQLDNMRNAISRMETDIKMAEVLGETEKVLKLQEQLISMREEERNLLHQTANELRSLQGEIENTFSSRFGKNIKELSEIQIKEYIDSLDKQIVDLQNKISNSTDDTVKLSLEKSVRDIEQDKSLFNFFTGVAKELGVELNKLSDDWFKSFFDGKSLSNANIKGQIEQIFKGVESALQPLNKELEDLDYKMKLLDNNDTAGKMQLTADKIAVLSSIVKATTLEMTRLEESTSDIIKNTDEYKQKIEQLEKSKRDTIVTIKQYNDELNNTNTKIADETISAIKDAYQKQRELTINALREELREKEKAHKRKIELLDEELSKYNEIIDAQIKSINRQSDEEDFQKQLQKANEERLEIVKEINVLSLDDSLDARNKVSELNKKLVAQDEKIDEMKNKRTKDLRVQNLNDVKDNFKKEVDAKKKSANDSMEIDKDNTETRIKMKEWEFDKLINDEARYAQLRKDIIAGNLSEVQGLMNSFIDEFSKHNEISVQKIDSSWQSLINTINRVKDAQSSLNNVSVNSPVGSQTPNISNPVTQTPSNSNQSDLDKILAMEKNDYLMYLINKRRWNETDNANLKVKYNNANQALRKKYGVTSDTFTYDFLKNIREYHEGGFVGGKALNPRHEEIAKLLKGELTLTPNHLNNLFNNFKSSQPNLSNIHKNNSNLKIDNLITINGNVDRTVIPKLEEIANFTVEKLKREFNKIGIMGSV